MKGVWAVMRMSFITYLRDRSAMFWGILFPLFLMGFIGMAWGGGNVHFNVAVVSPDAAVAGTGGGATGGEETGNTTADGLFGVSGSAAGTALSNGLLAALQSIPAFTVDAVDAATASDGFDNGDYAFVITLPDAAASAAVAGALSAAGSAAASGAANAAGATDAPGALGPPSSDGVRGTREPIPIDVLYDGSNEQVAQAGLAIVQQVVHGVNQQLTGRVDIVQVVPRERSGNGVSGFDFLLPGIIAMTLMQTGLMGVTWLVASYREKLILKRVMATPFHPVGFVTGLIGRFTIVNLIQATVIFLVATLLFDARTVGNLGEYTVLALFGSITFLSIGFAISTLSKTAESANNLGNLIAFPMMFLSGVFFPPEFMPEVIRPLVGLLPLTPLVEAMRGVATAGMHIGDFAPGLGYMGLWLAASLVVAARKFRWE